VLFKQNMAFQSVSGGWSIVRENRIFGMNCPPFTLDNSQLT